MTSGQRVLVIDGQSETEEVLKAVLEPRGLHVESIRGNGSPAANDEPAPPCLIVLHVDDVPSTSAEAENWNSVPRVIIGSTQGPSRSDCGDGRHFLRKPFEYRDLICAIEGLLAE